MLKLLNFIFKHLNFIFKLLLALLKHLLTLLKLHYYLCKLYYRLVKLGVTSFLWLLSYSAGGSDFFIAGRLFFGLPASKPDLIL